MHGRFASASVAAAVLIVPVFASAQKADLKAEALEDLAQMKASMVKISNEMPEAKFGYKSTASQRTYGEQILHVANANVTWTKTLGGTATAPPIDMKATSKAEIIKALEASFDYPIAVISSQPPELLLQQVKMPWSGELESRYHVVNSMIVHAWDMYGQMAVYLRLNGRVPPASQRP